MARTIPHRELRNNSSEVLRAVHGGETIEVTNNGVVVAVLVPPARRPAEHVRMRRASVRGGFGGLPRARLAHSVQDDLDALRDER